MTNKKPASVDWSRFSVVHRRVGGGVTALIERMVAGGELKPGDKLPPERDLALSLGVSRSSVRDALFELSFKGLIDRRPARGTIIRTPNSNARALIDAFDSEARKMLDIVDLRRVIEPAVCQRAAVRATSTQVDALQQNIADSYATMPPDEMARLDREFHLLLARTAQNELLTAVMTAVADMVHPFRVTSQQIDSDRIRSIEEHKRIVEAVRQGDGTAAYQAMKVHILNVGEMMLATAGIARPDERLDDSFVPNEPPSKRAASSLKSASQKNRKLQ